MDKGRSDEGFDISMERFVAQTSDQTMLWPIRNLSNKVISLEYGCLVFEALLCSFNAEQAVWYSVSVMTYRSTVGILVVGVLESCHVKVE